VIIQKSSQLLSLKVVKYRHLRSLQKKVKAAAKAFEGIVQQTSQKL
jgi:hypothetical protein